MGSQSLALSPPLYNPFGGKVLCSSFFSKYSPPLYSFFLSTPLHFFLSAPLLTLAVVLFRANLLYAHNYVFQNHDTELSIPVIGPH